MNKKIPPMDVVSIIEGCHKAQTGLRGRVTNETPTRSCHEVVRDTYRLSLCTCRPQTIRYRLIYWLVTRFC